MGTPESLYERPATRFVADFIGTTNLLRGEIIGIEDDGAVVRLETGELCRVGSGRRCGRNDHRYQPRPEAIRICGPEASPATSPTLDGVTSGWAVPATIEQVAYLGAAVRYLVRSQGGFAMTILAPTSGTALGRRFWSRSAGHRMRHSSSSISRLASRRSHEQRSLSARPSISNASSSGSWPNAGSAGATARADRGGRRDRRPCTHRRRVLDARRVGECRRLGRQHRPDDCPERHSAAAIASPTATPEPTPVPSPESELFIYNWDGTSARRPRPISRRSTGSRSSTTSSPTPRPRSPRSGATARGRLRPDLPCVDRCRRHSPATGSSPRSTCR